MKHKLYKVLVIATLLLTPFVSHAALGDILYGTANPSINSRLPIGATSTVMLSTGSVPSWIATSSLGITSSQWTSGSGLIYYMTMDGAGNLGIGTASPAAKLDVNGTAHIGTIANSSAGVLNIAGANYNQVNIAAGDNSGWGLLLGSDLASASASAYHGPSNDYIVNVNNAPLILGTSNAAQMTILGNGNVGIGTTAPSQALSVNGNVQANNIYLNTAGELDYWGGGTQYRTWMDNSSTYHYGAVQDYAIHSTMDAEDGGRGFTWGAYGSTPSMSVDVNGELTLAGGANIAGNVGIGTVSPLSKLVVSNGGATGFEVSPGINAYGLTDVTYLASYSRSGSAYKDLVFDTGNPATVPTLILKAGGNVGIGTPTPATALDVNGDATIETGAGHVGDLVCYMAGGKLGHMTQTALLAGAGSAVCSSN